MSASSANVNALAIMPLWEDRTSLTQIFGRAHWNVHFVDGWGDARPMIDQLGVGLVVSSSTLPDARWQDVLSELQRREAQPPLIVTSRFADDALWAEVLNLGGYDVLATPFSAAEVTRSISHAWRHWREKSAPQLQQASQVRRGGGSNR